MRCPICIRRGQASEVDAPVVVVRTLMGGQRNYYDEDGNHHWHDPNDAQDSYTCSNNHTFALEYRPCGSCDYGAAEAWERDACGECGHVWHGSRKCHRMRWVPNADNSASRGVSCECQGSPVQEEDSDG